MAYVDTASAFPEIATEPGESEPRLCRRCEDFERRVLNPWTKGYYYPGLRMDHYELFGQVVANAQDGCQLCRVLASGYLHAQIGRTDPAFYSHDEASEYLIQNDKAQQGYNVPGFTLTILRREFQDIISNEGLPWLGFSFFEYRREWSGEYGAQFMLCTDRSKCSCRSFAKAMPETKI